MESPKLASPFKFKIAALLGFVLFSNIFFFHSLETFGFVFFTLSFFVFLWLIFSQNLPLKTRTTLFLFYIGILLFYSASIVTRNSFLPSFLSRFAILFTLSLFIYTTARKLPFVRNLLELLLSPLHNGLSYVEGLIKTLIDTITPDSPLWQSLALKNLGRINSLIPWLIGVTIGIPVILLLTFLLSNADPIFGTYVGNVTKFFSRWFSGNLHQELFQRLILSFILLGGLFPLLYFTNKKETPLPRIYRLSFSKQIIVIIGAVAALLGTFLIIQWPYVFVKVAFETHLSQFGVKTYSEYVKRGFGEFIFITFLVYGLLWLGLIVKRNTSENKRLLYWIQYILFAEFFLFLLSIFRRIYLYQAYHGWSLIRIYGSFLLLWILTVTITLALRHFSTKRFALIETIFTAIFIGCIGLFNAESFIVSTHPPTVNKRIDYVYLSRMSPDGYIGWKMAYTYAQKVLFETSYPSNTPIGKEDRQRIAYAGSITRMLSNNYFILMQKYGTNDQKKTYFQTILENQKALISSAEKSVQPVLVETKYPSPTPVIIPDEYNYQKVMSQKVVVNEELKKLKTCNDCLGEIESVFSITYWFYPESYYPNSSLDSTRWFVDISQNIPIRNEARRKVTSLDKLFTYNVSSHQAFKNIYQDMPIETLISLQNTYLKLYDRIASQPEKERDYEIDISTDSPLLGSF